MNPQATVSVDVDPVDLHLVGYGHASAGPDPLVYDAALERLVARLASRGMRATFFVVGRDASRRAGALRALAAAGHELASHSMHHPLGFSRLDDARLSVELEGSRHAIADAAGAPVDGFRAPNFDLDRRTLAAVRAAGYRYDASAYPTPVLLAARLALAAGSRRPGAVLALVSRPFTWSRGPHALPAGGGTLHEFPASVTPVLRIPVYHTLRYAMSEARFARLIAGFARRGETLSYTLHAVDALGLAEDGVDPRLRRHPGMTLPLQEKLGMLERVLDLIARDYRVVPFRERLPAT